LAIYHPPIPPVFTGGAQPYAGRKGLREEFFQPVDNPPFSQGGPYVEILEFASISQPNPWVYAFMGRQQPFERRKLPVAISAVPEDNPPFTQLGRSTQILSEIAYLSYPDPWTYTFMGRYQPYGPRKFSPGIPGAVVDNPPFTSPERNAGFVSILTTISQPNPWTYSFTGGRGPFLARVLPVSVSSVAENNPPFGMRNRVTLAQQIVKSWEPGPPLPWIRHGSFRIRLSRGRGWILG